MPILGLGVPELVIILVIVLIIFGPRKLPDIGKALGSSLRELKKSAADKEEDEEKDEKAKSKKEEDE
jgi:sec-independent protein translocase protein TatA